MADKPSTSASANRKTAKKDLTAVDVLNQLLECESQSEVSDEDDSDDSYLDADYKLPSDASSDESVSLLETRMPLNDLAVVVNADDSVNYVQQEEEAVESMKVKSRKRKSDPDSWKKTVRTKLCRQGKEHVDSTGKAKAEKKPRPNNCLNCKFNCNENFSEENRVELCSLYWGLEDYARKKDFILANIRVLGVERTRLKGDRQKKKSRAIQYFFRKGENNLRICKKFFQNTLSISHGPVDKAVAGIKEELGTNTFTLEDRRGKHSPANKTAQASLETVRNHIKSFPQVESHYTRKDTQRKYLNQKLTITKMYELYQQKCEASDPVIQPVSQRVYRNVFCDEFNLSFFKPKKDQCLSCTKYKMSKAGDEDAHQAHQAHLRRNRESKISKENDKLKANDDPSFASATFDLQSVLQIPHSDVSLMYYSRKICIYNLCIWEAKEPHDGHCFCWNETEGKRGSNEIATCVFKWLSNLPPIVKNVSLYSDTCSGQNRNQNIAAMFLYALHKLPLESITQNFLESGHSEMEVDSMHSAIEREKKYVDTFTMIDWLNIFKKARKKNPYKVLHLHHKDFTNFKELAKSLIQNRRKDQDGNIVNWLLVKSFQYRKSDPNILFYRYSYSDEFKSIHISRRGRPNLFPDSIPNVYNHQLPISDAKKADLLKLCSQFIIPQEVHAWYKALPTSNRVNDKAPEPAVDDSSDDDDETYEDRN